MSSERRNEANRRNAARSTGPATEAGKAVSRGNALRHGLAGEGTVLLPDEKSEVERRAVEWSAVFRPLNALESFYVSQYALESVRIERCQAHERALRNRLAFRALDADLWDEDRRLEAEEIGARLARDPARTVRRLRQTLQGCDWLLERWNQLVQALDAGSTWNDAQRALALDLLGIPPALRDGPTPADPAPTGGPSAQAPQRALALGRIAELTRYRNVVLVEIDEADRDAATSGIEHGDGSTQRALRLVRRYEAACRRRLDQAMRLLLSGKLSTLPPRPTPDDRTGDTDAPAPPKAQPPGPAAPPPSRAAAAASLDDLDGDLDDEPTPLTSQTTPTLRDAIAEPKGGNRRWRRAQKRLSRRKAA